MITPEKRNQIISLPAFNQGDRICFLLGAFVATRPHHVDGYSEILLSTGGPFEVLECALPPHRAMQEIDAQSRIDWTDIKIKD